MANDTTLHSDLVAALSVASLSQNGAGVATRATNDWARIDKVPAIALCPIYQLRTIYSVVSNRDSNNVLDMIAVELVQAFRIDATNTEALARTAARLNGRTLSRPSWWAAASPTQIMRAFEDELEITTERIGRAVVLTVTISLQLKP